MTAGTHQGSDEVSSTTVDAIIERHGIGEGALIPILQELQERCGYLPTPLLHHVADRLGIPYSVLAGVVSFYSFFSTTPRGKHTVRACLGTACYVRGGRELLDSLRKRLAIEVGETTSDRQFSLEVGRCFGACGLAPVVVIGEDVHQRVKPARVNDLLARYREVEDVC